MACVHCRPHRMQEVGEARTRSFDQAPARCSLARGGPGHLRGPSLRRASPAAMATLPHGAQLMCSNHSPFAHKNLVSWQPSRSPVQAASAHKARSLLPSGCPGRWKEPIAHWLQTTDLPLNLGQATPPLQPHFSIAEYLLQTQLFPTAHSFPSPQSWALLGRWSQHGAHPITHLLYVLGGPTSLPSSRGLQNSPYP